MKKLSITLFAFILFSCSTNEDKQITPEQTCYNIIARGYDSRGNYIIINYSEFVQKRYKVNNYQDYIGQSQLCDPITLTEQPL